METHGDFALNEVVCQGDGILCTLSHTIEIEAQAAEVESRLYHLQMRKKLTCGVIKTDCWPHINCVQNEL